MLPALCHSNLRLPTDSKASRRTTRRIVAQLSDAKLLFLNIKAVNSGGFS